MKIFIALLIGALLLVIGIFFYKESRKNQGNHDENMCVETKFSGVTDLPYSSFVNANMALVHSTSIGAAPLGEPKFWNHNGTNSSPVFQGMYGYTDNWQTAAEKAYGESEEMENYYPVYTDRPFGDY